MELAKEWITGPLCSLVSSPHNVRRHSANHIEELAALIADCSQVALPMINGSERPEAAGRGVKVIAGKRTSRPKRLRLLPSIADMPRDAELSEAAAQGRRMIR